MHSLSNACFCVVLLASVPAIVQARVPLCPYNWCDMKNCYLGGGQYWQLPGQSCGSENCQCQFDDYCDMGGNEDFSLCYCLPCIE